MYFQSETPETGMQSKFEGLTSKIAALEYDSNREPVQLFY